ncbi:MAG: hypothetical protein GY738_27930 [Pseudoalteromonas sp.]|nr:hypothetical protein [Pseudoalteromonas sp.]
MLLRLVTHLRLRQQLRLRLRLHLRLRLPRRHRQRSLMAAMCVVAPMGTLLGACTAA